MMSSSSLKNAGKDTETASNSSSTNGDGGGNNSDNSAMISLGNTSFGFNFESDGGFNNSSGSNSPPSSEGGDSDQGDRKPKANGKGNKDGINRRNINKTPSPNRATTTTSTITTETETSSESDEGKEKKQPQQQEQAQTQPPIEKSFNAVNEKSSADPGPMSAGAAAAKSSSDSMMKPAPPAAASPSTPPENDSCSTTIISVSTGNSSSSHKDAAAAAVANLKLIAADATKKIEAENEDAEKRGLKRKCDKSDDDDSGGYNSDDDEMGKSNAGTSAQDQIKKEPGGSCCSTEENASLCEMEPTPGGGNKKKKLDDSKREERNAREKERSFRISRQINQLRALLSSGGVIVPKGTKSSVLTEAANYIRMLQQHQYRSEIDRHQLVQQVQKIGSGALGQQAASAVRHVAAQNGVWSLGNFGGVPPKSAMMYHQPSEPTADETPSSASGSRSLPNTIEETDYRHVFNSCTIGMAIASMGGAFIDCNKLFCQIANYTKQEICSMTVFNLTARQDLQSAFDLISQMLSAPLDPTVTNTSCVLRGALKHRTNIGLSVKLIKGSDGVAKCFCVTLITNPASPYDTSKPTPATFGGHVGTGQILPGAKDSQAGLNPSPAYTAG